MAESVGNTEAVSYTHLDVYKRQIYRKPGHVVSICAVNGALASGLWFLDLRVIDLRSTLHDWHDFYGIQHVSHGVWATKCRHCFGTFGSHRVCIRRYRIAPGKFRRYDDLYRNIVFSRFCLYLCVHAICIVTIRSALRTAISLKAFTFKYLFLTNVKRKFQIQYDLQKIKSKRSINYNSPINLSLIHI